MTQTEGGDVECALQRKFLVWITKWVDECQWEKTQISTVGGPHQGGMTRSRSSASQPWLQLSTTAPSGAQGEDIVAGLLSDAVPASEGSFSTVPSSPGFQSLSGGAPASLGACSQTWLLPPVMELLFF